MVSVPRIIIIVIIVIVIGVKSLLIQQSHTHTHTHTYLHTYIHSGVHIIIAKSIPKHTFKKIPIS